MKQPFSLTAAWLLTANLNLHAQGCLTPPASGLRATKTAVGSPTMPDAGYLPVASQL